MIECFKTTPVGTVSIEKPESGCWVNVVAPTPSERSWLQETLNILPEFLRSSLDDEETSHVDYDDDTGSALVIVDCPFVEDKTESEDASIVQYDTHPLCLLFLPEEEVIVSVSLRENDTVSLFAKGKVKAVNTNQRARLLLLMMLRISQRYQACLRYLDKQFRENEKLLRKTMRNEELIKMLGFEKSLVYFSTSLKSTEATLTRVAGGRVIKLYEEDRDLLDDVFIEMRQAQEMCNILISILNGVTDTFSSVINNNLNLTMRALTIITLMLSIPTIVFSFYGMNVDGLPMASWALVPVIIAVLACCGVFLFIKRSRFLR